MPGRNNPSPRAYLSRRRQMPESLPNATVLNPPAAAESEDRLWSVAAHAGTLFAGFLAPLLVLLIRGDQSPWVRAQAIESLNFQLTLIMAAFASLFLTVVAIGILTALITAAAGVALVIVAASRAN